MNKLAPHKTPKTKETVPPETPGTLFAAPIANPFKKRYNFCKKILSLCIIFLLLIFPSIKSNKAQQCQYDRQHDFCITIKRKRGNTILF